MRNHSTYDFFCNCGQHIECEDSVGICPNCKREYEVRFVVYTESCNCLTSGDSNGKQND